MNTGPSYKVIIPVASVYVILLFIPTIDIGATYSINLLFFSLPFSIASFIFPAIYPLSDSITEVYGKKIAYYLVGSCYIVTISFSFLNNYMLSISENYDLYSFMVKNSILITTIGPIAYFSTSVLNVKLLSRLKYKMRGQHFILRSLVCSSISELMISFMIYPFIFYDKGITFIILVSIGTSIIKIILTFPMVFIAKVLVMVYQYIDGIKITPYHQGLADHVKRNATIVKA